MTSQHREEPFSGNHGSIQTSNVKCLTAIANELIGTNEHATTMGIVTGAPGTGKSTAARIYQALCEQEHAALLPQSIMITVMPHTTIKALLCSIVEQSGHSTSLRNTYDIFEEAVTALDQRNEHLLMIDEADRLTQESLHVLASLFNQTACPILLIGQPKLLVTIQANPRLASRIGSPMVFPSLSQQEVLDVVLPQLVIPSWSFDPQKEADCHLGKEIWQNVCPSLRRLTHLLALSSQLAQMSSQPIITQTILREAWKLMALEDWQDLN